MEGLNLSQENNEDNFNKFKEKINEKAYLYKNIISSFFSEVAIVDKYKGYQDQIDSEAFLCTTKIKELMDITTRELSKSDKSQKVSIDELFDTPIKTLDTQLEAAKIMLDTKPYDVWQKKHDEFNKQIEELEKNTTLTIVELQKLQGIKKLFDDSLEELFISKDKQLHDLQELFSLSQKNQFSVTANDKSVNINTNMKIQDDIVANYNAKIFEIVDAFDFNTREIMEKAFSDFNSEKNNLN